MALDAIDPAQWALLETATDEYLQQEDVRLDEACQILLKGLGPLPNTGLQHIRCGMLSWLRSQDGLSKLDRSIQGAKGIQGF